MRNMSEFQIIGNVSRIKEFPKNIKVSIGATYSKKNANGEFENDTFWNEVTIWNPKTIEWVKANVKKGNLVFARGTIRQTSYDSKDGKVYTYDLSAREFSLLERAPAQESTDEPEERGTTQAPSSDAPF
ncbi:MAG TPA: single-stranded DNA-binding protein [Beijerinckiaceae bacterium]|nr:single-stranded DNA-binding protein [Rhodoblastus sp.]MCC2107929.1 single-stranded DNA-binding protein [Hyphomicrobiales bacterium]MCO5089199.1 single-stranded DNA-binding protein [Methylobacteriaceae bacterium]HRY01598.1 single-stranded DNA-binding protein [Beijerinckiaceae bacterium]